jgi:hypothetical protein
LERSVSLTSKELDIVLEGNELISSLLHNLLFGRIPNTNHINYVDLFKSEYKDDQTMPFLINIESARRFCPPSVLSHTGFS